MPTYEYLCEKCEHEFEREQSINDPPIKTCPKCKGRKVKKLISATSFVLKGGGWYSDGYGSAKNDTKGSSSSEGSSGSGGESSKSESKPEAKSETKGTSKSTAKKGKDAA